MVTLTIRDNFPEVDRRLQQLGSEIQARVVSAALNRTAEKGRAQMSRDIRSEFNLRASEINPRLRVRKASARGLQLVAELEALPGSRRGRSLNVIHFLERKVTLAEARRRRKGGTLSQLRFRIRRTGGLKTIPGAFVVTANRGTFVARRTGRKRLPIESVQTIDVPQMFNTRRINERVVRHIEREFPIEFTRASRAFVEGFNR